MKGSIIVLLFFAAGCLLGVMGWLPFNPEGSNLTLYMLYALMLQVGLSIGSSKDLKFIVGSLRPKYLLIRWEPYVAHFSSPHWPACCSHVGASSTAWR